MKEIRNKLYEGHYVIYLSSSISRNWDYSDENRTVRCSCLWSKHDYDCITNTDTYGRWERPNICNVFSVRDV